jgi:hypothetical protein
MDAHGRISILHATSLRELWYTIDHTDCCTAFPNELIAELLQAQRNHSKKENAIVERANKEVLRISTARVHDK